MKLVADAASAAALLQLQQEVSIDPSIYFADVNWAPGIGVTFFVLLMGLFWGRQDWFSGRAVGWLFLSLLFFVAWPLGIIGAYLSAPLLQIVGVALEVE